MTHNNRINMAIIAALKHFRRNTFLTNCYFPNYRKSFSNISSIPWISNASCWSSASYEDSLVIAAFKPTGVLSHPNNDTDFSNSLVLAPYDRAQECYWIRNGLQKEPLYLINRLDKDTSGLILLSGDKNNANYIKDLFKKREVSKTYIAKTFGMFKSKKQEIWTDTLTIEKSDAFVRAHNRNYSKDAKIAKTSVSLLSIRLKDDWFKEYSNTLKQTRGPTTSLLVMNPLTGFSHQLRYQCSLRGFPIVGDEVYGNFDLNKLYRRNDNTNSPQSVEKNASLVTEAFETNERKLRGKNRLFLHSFRILFKQFNGKIFEARAQIPESFFE